MTLELFHPGLEGVIAGETNISGIEGEFVYRGYPVSDLVDGAGFLEVAHLLLTEELPTQEQLADFRSLLWEDAVLPEQVVRFVRELPLHVGPMEALRSGVSLLGNCDAQMDDPVGESGVSQAIRLLARVPLLLGEWMRLRDGLPPVEPEPVISYAANVLALATRREPTPAAERAFSASLILAADYAFTPATYIARLAAASGANLMSAVTAALSPLASPEASHLYAAVLAVLSSVGTCEQAERWVKYRVGESLPLPGFQPAGEQGADPRAELLKNFCDELADESGDHWAEEIAEAIERSVGGTVQRSPALEWPAARLYDALGIDRDLHPAMFVCGRLVGWCAHFIEQAESGEEIRPRSRYRGAEEQLFEPLVLRG